MAKNYVYRMDRDTGFAPHIESDNFCSLTGCKDTTVEVWAKKDSWIIGIGGEGTGRPDKLIYAMKVKENVSYEHFRNYPKESKYLDEWYAVCGARPRSNVLISSEFYYFGDKAIDLPTQLKHIVWNRQGCRCVSDQDVNELKKHLTDKGYRYGKLGEPNNTKNQRSNKTACRSQS